MTLIRLEHENFDAADTFAAILAERQMTVSAASADGPADQRTTIYVCSAAHEAQLGGEQQAVAAGRAARAGSMMIIEENAARFAITETLGGKLVRVALPAGQTGSVADDYGLQLAATLLADSRTVACGDAASRNLLGLARRVAATDVTVFVNGPTGTGKEVLARFIHNHSDRSEAPFVAVNCAAIPDNMLEAILFGHEKGAFTGASTSNKGIFRAADGGTLLLDEISEMPMALQAKLLRALQERALRRLARRPTFRLMAGGGNDKPKHGREIRDGNFREDLYYRLNVFPLNTVSLCERGDDIVPIATFLLSRHVKTLANMPWLDTSAIAALKAHGWPGNVRELENVLQRALVLSQNGVISANEVLIDTVLQDTLGATAGFASVFRRQQLAPERTA